MKVLIVDDEPTMAQAMISCLRRTSDWEIHTAETGAEALKKFESGQYHMAVIDWELPEPGPDGLELCSKFRKRSGTAGLIMVTSREYLTDKLQAFDAGADDYLTKPFNVHEFTARMKVLARRSSAPPSPTRPEPDAPTLELGPGAVVEPEKSMAYGPRGGVQLSPAELGLIQQLANAAPACLTAEQIATNVLTTSGEAGLSLVYRHIANVNAKLAAVGLQGLILRGSHGYTLRRE